MPRGAIELKTDARTQRDIRKLITDMSSLSGGKIPTELRKALRKAVAPARKHVQEAAMNLPSKQSTHELRSAMARAVRIQIGSGQNPNVALICRLSGDESPMPRVTNKGEWRHPVYGHAEVYVTQTSTAGWFDKTAEADQTMVVHELEATALTFERKIV